MWLASCTVLFVTAVLIAMSIWTVVAYQRTLSDLQTRLEVLETEYQNLDQIVENKVNTLLDKVSWQSKEKVKIAFFHTKRILFLALIQF